MFGIPDYVRYIEEFVITRFVISRFYSIHFTVTFGQDTEYRSLYRGLRKIALGPLDRGSTVLEEVGRHPQKSRNEILTFFRKPQIPFSLTTLHVSFWNSTLTY